MGSPRKQLSAKIKTSLSPSDGAGDVIFYNAYFNAEVMNGPPSDPALDANAHISIFTEWILNEMPC